jgi:YD repeat-containing protein
MSNESDRQKAGLRGPVRTCIEEAKFPEATAPDGTKIPERKFWYTTEYDVDGHITARRNRQSDGSVWVLRNTYSASGHLLKTKSGTDGEPSQETNYSYDGQGRPLSVTDSRTPDNPITFRYDEHGRKMKVQVSRPEDYRPNTAVGGSPFEVADMPPNLPGGGSATTIYDEDDRPTEVQIRDTKGKLVKRAVRTFDAQGRIGEERQIWDNFESMFPAGTFDKILESSGASSEELREQLRGQLTKLMGGQEGPFSVVYNYDAQGRVNQTHRQIFNQEHVIETTYNEHGDKAAEITRGTQIGSEEEQSNPGSGLPPYSAVQYSYRYDDYANWTEQNVSYSLSQSGAFEPSTGGRRTLTYY